MFTAMMFVIVVVLAVFGVTYMRRSAHFERAMQEMGATMKARLRARAWARESTPAKKRKVGIRPVCMTWNKVMRYQAGMYKQMDSEEQRMRAELIFGDGVRKVLGWAVGQRVAVSQDTRSFVLVISPIKDGQEGGLVVRKAQQETNLNQIQLQAQRYTGLPLVAHRAEVPYIAEGAVLMVDLSELAGGTRETARTAAR